MKADKIAFLGPDVYEDVDTFDLICPEYEGTDMFVRCTLTYDTGTHVKALFQYSDSTSEEFTVPLGKPFFVNNCSKSNCLKYKSSKSI